MNNLGEVVGWSKSADNPASAFVYNASDGMVALNDLIDPNSAWDLRSAISINKFGQIAGVGYLNDDRRAFRFTPGVGDKPAVVEDLGTFGGDYSEAWAINDHGDVAGSSTDANGTGRAFVWTAQGGMVDIGDLGGGRAYARGINNSGQVTGTSLGTNWHAFRYTPGAGMEDLGDFGYYHNRVHRSDGRDINEAGHVVGQARNLKQLKGWSVRHAFLYTDHLEDLGKLGGWDSYARGINSSGYVVGVSHESTEGWKIDQPDHGFLYTAEFGMVKLQDLIVDLPEGFQGPIWPWKINDDGQICGEADGEAFLLTPTPLP